MRKPAPKIVRQVATVLCFPLLWYWRCKVEKDTFKDFLSGWKVIYSL